MTRESPPSEIQRGKGMPLKVGGDLKQDEEVNHTEHHGSQARYLDFLRSCTAYR